MKQIYSICLNFLMNLLRTALRETGGIVITTNPDVKKMKCFLRYLDMKTEKMMGHSDIICTGRLHCKLHITRP